MSNISAKVKSNKYKKPFKLKTPISTSKKTLYLININYYQILKPQCRSEDGCDVLVSLSRDEKFVSGCVEPVSNLFKVGRNEKTI